MTKRKLFTLFSIIVFSLVLRGQVYATELSSSSLRFAGYLPGTTISGSSGTLTLTMASLVSEESVTINNNTKYGWNLSDVFKTAGTTSEFPLFSWTLEGSYSGSPSLKFEVTGPLVLDTDSNTKLAYELYLRCSPSVVTVSGYQNTLSTLYDYTSIYYRTIVPNPTVRYDANDEWMLSDILTGVTVSANVASATIKSGDSTLAQTITYKPNLYKYVPSTNKKDSLLTVGSITRSGTGYIKILDSPAEAGTYSATLTVTLTAN